MNIFERESSVIDAFKILKETKLYKNTQLEELYEALNAGLIPEQMEMIADSQYDWRQMKELRSGFEHRLTIEQVKLYANQKYTWLEMKKYKEAIEEKEK